MPPSAPGGRGSPLAPPGGRGSPPCAALCSLVAAGGLRATHAPAAAGEEGPHAPAAPLPWWSSAPAVAGSAAALVAGSPRATRAPPPAGEGLRAPSAPVAAPRAAPVPWRPALAGIPRLPWPDRGRKWRGKRGGWEEGAERERKRWALDG